MSNQSSTRSRTESLWAIGVILLGLVALDLSIPSAIAAVVVLGCLILAGSSILVSCGFSRTSAGASLVLSAGALAFISQLLIAQGIAAVSAYWISLACLVITAGLLVLRHTPTKRNAILFGISNETITSLLVVIFVFSLRHPWYFLFAMSVYGSMHASRILHVKPASQFIRFVVPILGFVISLQLQPDFWWFFYNHRSDMGFFESTSWVTSHWGIDNLPGFAGAHDFRYHWFSFLFLGGLSHLLQLEPFVALTRIGPPLQIFIFASALQGLFRLPNQIRQAPIGFGLITLLLISWTLTRFDSFTFGLGTILTLFLLVVQLKNNCVNRLLPSLAIGFVAAIATMSKAPTALTFGIAVSVVWILFSKWTEKSAYLPVVGCSIGGGIAYLSLLSGGSSDRYFFKRNSLSLNQIGYEFLAITPAIALMIVLAPLLLAVRRDQGRLMATQRDWLRASAIIALTSSLVPLAIANFDQIMIPAQFLLLVTTLWAISGDPRMAPALDVTRWKLIKAFVIFGASIAAGFTYPVIANLLGRELGFSISVDKLWELCVRYTPYFLIASSITVVIARQREIRTYRLVSVTLIICLGFVSGLNLDNARRHLEYGHEIYLNLDQNDPVFATADLRAVGKFIRDTTPDEMLLASNNFCCSGTEWWSQILQDVSGYVAAGAPTRWGGDNHLVQAEARRQIFIQGPADKSLLPDLEKIDRINLSLGFANSPTHEIARELQNYGVGGFVVNLRLTGQRDWSDFAVERFRSGDFIFLELK